MQLTRLDNLTSGTTKGYCSNGSSSSVARRRTVGHHRDLNRFCRPFRGFPPISESDRRHEVTSERSSRKRLIFFERFRESPLLKARRGAQSSSPPMLPRDTFAVPWVVGDRFRSDTPSFVLESCRSWLDPGRPSPPSNSHKVLLHVRHRDAHVSRPRGSSPLQSAGVSMSEQRWICRERGRPIRRRRTRAVFAAATSMQPYAKPNGVGREEWARRITDAKAHCPMSPRETSPRHAVSTHVEVLETVSRGAAGLRTACPTHTSLVETNEVVGIACLLRDVLARLVSSRSTSTHFDLCRVLTPTSPPPTRIANTAAVGFVRNASVPHPPGA